MKTEKIIKKVNHIKESSPGLSSQDAIEIEKISRMNKDMDGLSNCIYQLTCAIIELKSTINKK